MYRTSNQSFATSIPLCAPTACLPSLSKLPLSLFSSTQLQDSLGKLLELYAPQPQPPRSALPPKLILPTRKHRQVIHDDSVPDSGYASAEEEEEDDNCTFEEEEEEEEELLVPNPNDDDQMDILRADPLERAFALKWLTNFIARSDEWVSSARDSEEEEEEAERRAEAVASATNLLSILLGDDQEEPADVSLTRSFRFSLSDGQEPRIIEVELNDAPLSDADHTCVGLQSWASSVVLSERMCKDPSNEGVRSTGLRVLELGAGTGLLSIVVAKILSSSGSSPSSSSSVSPLGTASIFATDYHPEVLCNLRDNISTNFPAPPISIHQLDWEHPDYSAPLDEPFDLILGADVIYHPEHARWIKSCVERLLARGGIFWLMMALRIGGRHEGMFHTVEDIFPDADEDTHFQKPDWHLAILEKYELGKMKGVGRADESGYLLFKIGWVWC
ncbi:S-adenosyl-L-methionine-dependent methyltransferase [Lentinula raphanica]|nr:S-adenosyl-L-methionine-dependent methyltransferase [Lentinula raphanica]